ncbi:MAG: hypothetical protein A3J93_03335 [Candidatus Magasanikbacteria bacterium RIFOXYC2_FULL_42_28]|uniref:Uncharacterized protein n=1 Tax=Candidatus Magasanikbacteria bacterium RIFOXYC2_FULL_42_28 TaxID=1798704 RepID=A0A1F6NUE4_9BACT|nr:MAG: hypothetical protein A3J93_03335 [Candidatus Magasanikbacteria bacterium RIFOXYC2_FULL_42_28]
MRSKETQTIPQQNEQVGDKKKKIKPEVTVIPRQDLEDLDTSGYATGPRVGKVLTERDGRVKPKPTAE